MILSFACSNRLFCARRFAEVKFLSDSRKASPIVDLMIVADLPMMETSKAD